MNFKIVMDNFNSSNKAKIIDTKYKTYEIKWKFENFPEIISKPSFLSYISTSFDFQFSALMIDDIENKIQEIRDLFFSTNQAVERYLSEIEHFEHQALNSYQDFLLSSYVNIKEFVNEYFISWIFNNALHKTTKYKNEDYDTELFFDFQRQMLKLKFQKMLRKIIKLVVKILPNDETFKLLDNQYEKDINQKKLALNQLKFDSKLN